MEVSQFTVFISWSKEPSGEIAKHVQRLLGKIFPAPNINFFVSNVKISGGDNFRYILDDKLENSNFGILVLTNNNIAQPWIMFEAGALSKHSDNTKITPILFGRNYKDREAPIEQFNYIDYVNNSAFIESDEKFINGKEKDFFNNLILPITRKLYGIKEPSQEQIEQLKDSLDKFWENFEKKIDEILAKPTYSNIEELSKDVTTLMMDEKAYEKVYSKRDDQLGELIKQLQSNTSKRIVIFGGIPTAIRKSYKELASWLILNKDSKLFICYENENIAGVRMNDLGVPKNKIEEVKEMKKNIEALLGTDVINRVHFIEIEKSTSLYIALDGSTMYFTPALDKRSSETFTFKLKNSPLISDLLNYMKSRIENLSKKENKIFIDELKNN
jgi:hypothetical protein